MRNYRKLSGKVVIATHNAGKLREIRDLLKPYGIEAVSAGELNLPEPDETGTIFAENAVIKAQAAAKLTNLPSFADDSGVCVHALDGAPGLFSARWGGATKDFVAAMNRVECELNERDVPHDKRTAHFVSALVIAWPDGHTELFEGRIYGDLVFPPRGNQGFGYDAMFRPERETRTFGEMSALEKHGLPPTGAGLSHRAKAFMKLAECCLEGES
jgi:XTP/dITP diphosphohydrolase